MNTKWPWMTAARFRPELVPEELMAQGLTVCNDETYILFNYTKFLTLLALFLKLNLQP